VLCVAESYTATKSSGLSSTGPIFGGWKIKLVKFRIGHLVFWSSFVEGAGFASSLGFSMGAASVKAGVRVGAGASSAGRGLRVGAGPWSYLNLFFS